MTTARIFLGTLVSAVLGCGRHDLDLLVTTAKPDVCLEQVSESSCSARLLEGARVGCSWQPNDPGCAGVGCQPGSCRSGDPFVRRVERRLLLNGQSFRFVGVGGWGLLQPEGCRSVPKEAQEGWLERAFDELVPSQTKVVRLFAFQSSFGEGGNDFGLLDRAVGFARRAGVRLMLVLEHGQGGCSQGGVRDSQWYRSGYLEPDLGYALSYRDFAKALAERYRDEPTVLSYGLMLGLYADDPIALSGFITDVGQMLHGVAPSQLVSLDLTWSREEDPTAQTFEALQSLPVVDFVDVDDYFFTPGEPGIDPTLWAAIENVGKPAVVGQGAFIVEGFEPPQFEERARQAGERLRDWHEAGYNGALLWAYHPGWDTLSEEFDARPEDPLLQPNGVLANAPW